MGSGFEVSARADASGTVHTRFGEPSSPIRRITLATRDVMMVLRHGDDHTLAPHVINYRANLQALADLGAGSVVALNTVGAVTQVRKPGEIAVPDQIIDYTWGREHTIYDAGAEEVQHIEFTEPFAQSLRGELLRAAAAAAVDCFDGGVYAATQGPRLETAAEIRRIEADGADFVGMTAMPEAALARELGLDYACVALVVNHAAGRGQAPLHADVALHTQTALALAMRILERFFAAIGERGA